DQEELIHLISNYSKISLYQHHLTKSPKVSVYTLSKEETDTFVYSMIFLTSTFTPAVGLEPTTS
ncbi:hypothetical protein LDA55_14775, partial [Enterococcus faecium]|nr:hypothetical protein [Enterococcus faecium]MCH3655545.1 hypothetical protein [Enterococcus faecium]